jgi:hypothetical protein
MVAVIAVGSRRTPSSNIPSLPVDLSEDEENKCAKIPIYLDWNENN